MTYSFNRNYIRRYRRLQPINRLRTDQRNAAILRVARVRQYRRRWRQIDSTRRSYFYGVRARTNLYSHSHAGAA